MSALRGKADVPYPLSEGDRVQDNAVKGRFAWLF
jgi:hypothetical protein